MGRSRTATAHSGDDPLPPLRCWALRAACVVVLPRAPLPPGAAPPPLDGLPPSLHPPASHPLAACSFRCRSPIPLNSAAPSASHAHRHSAPAQRALDRYCNTHTRTQTGVRVSGRCVARWGAHSSSPGCQQQVGGRAAGRGAGAAAVPEAAWAGEQRGVRAQRAKAARAGAAAGEAGRGSAPATNQPQAKSDAARPSPPLRRWGGAA